MIWNRNLNTELNKNIIYPPAAGIAPKGSILSLPQKILCGRIFCCGEESRII